MIETRPGSIILSQSRTEAEIFVDLHMGEVHLRVLCACGKTAEATIELSRFRALCGRIEQLSPIPPGVQVGQ